MDHISEPSPFPSLDIIPPFPISEYAYTATMGARNSKCIQTSMAAFQGSAMDSDAETILTSEGLNRQRNPHQLLSGYVDGFAEMSRNGHVTPLPYSVRQHKGEALSDSQSAFQASSPVIVTPSITSNRGASVDGIPCNFRCRTCGVNFVQRQGLNRHEKDKHRQRKTCPLCSSYTWPSGRRYLLLRHLEKHRPEAAIALAIGRLSDL